MIWHLSHRADPKARDLADRHYSRQKIGSPQFVPPGRCCVMYADTDSGRAFWVTSWPFAKYVKHAWAGAWICSAFRNEGAGVASSMIREAIAATRWFYGDPPDIGIVTFLNPRFVKPIKVRGKDTYGRTFILAGFKPCGSTKGGLLAFRMAPENAPEERMPMVDVCDYSRICGLLASREFTG